MSDIQNSDISVDKRTLLLATANVEINGIGKVQRDLLTNTKPTGKCSGIMLPQYYECLKEIDDIVGRYFSLLRRDLQDIRTAINELFNTDEEVAKSQFNNKQ